MHVCQPTLFTSMIIVDLPGHMVNNRGEVGGSVKTHRFETLVIGFHHPLDTVAVWVLWISILHQKRKTMPLKGKESHSMSVSQIVQL